MKFLSKINYSLILSFIALAVLSYFSIFHFLNYLPLQPWDEALFAIRSFYFYENWTFIKNFNQIDGLSSLTNTKPGLFTAIQAIFFHIFGVNELSLRLPVALCFFLIIVVQIYISKQEWKSFYPGILSGLVIITSVGMLINHAGRSGNQDVPFALFMLAASFFGYKFINNQKKSNILVFLIFFYAAFFTKSVAAFLLIPVFFLYALQQKKIIYLLKNNLVWITFLATLLPLIISFLDNVNHVGNYKRLVVSVNQHSGSIFFYLKYLFQEAHFIPWLLVLPFSFFLKNQSKLISFLLIQVVVIFIILSLSQTKLYWYLIVLYPIMSLLVGFTLYFILKKLPDFFPYQKVNKYLFITLTLLLIFMYPYYKAMGVVFEEDIPQANHRVGFLLKKTIKKHPEIKNIGVVVDFYSPHIEFYSIMMKRNHDLTINVLNGVDEIDNLKHVILYNHHQMQELFNCYYYKELNSSKNVSLYELINKKVNYCI